MKKLLILNLDGDFATGFDVNWEIGPDGQRPFANGMSRLALPPCPDLERAYQNWRDPYRRLDGNRIKRKPNQITNVRYTDLLSECQQTADNFANVVNDWFDSSPLSKTIYTDLLTNLEDEYRVIFCTDNPHVRQIPWLLWAGWKKFKHLEISLGAPYTQRRDRIYQQQVRVLVILGNSDGIDIEADRQILAGYRQEGAYLEFLAQPTIDRLRQQLLDERGWDILFFSGHSRTENVSSGRIFLNHIDSLTMAELRIELTTAIEKGLQLAIFNSCDGLGIAAELESLYIPQVIVMRQPVPDRVAQDFLKYFLAEFTSGKSLYQSVSIARDKLKQLEADFPCASWLPVIIQNRLEIPPTWQSLGSIPKCPYRGLSAFREEDKDYFGGRESFTQSLVQAVNSQSIVPLIGASGSGKSSVVFAGLIPLLRQEQEHPWEIVSFRPGNSPLTALAIAAINIGSAKANAEECQLLESELAQNIDRDELALVNFITEHHIIRDRRLLLIIDRFEELYTLNVDKSDRAKFLKNILTALDRLPEVRLLFTLRADCYNYILQEPVLVTALESINNKRLIPMNRSALTDAIVIPAQKLNIQFEEGLIEIILAPVLKSNYSLPLLEFVLTLLWARQENGYLTRRAYEDIGGLEGALASHAEDFYQQLTFKQQEQTRHILLQLVQVGDRILPTRRVAKYSEFGENNWEFIEYLAAGRLIAIDWDENTKEQILEVIHESLIDRWHTFKLWINSDRDFRHWQEQLRSAMDRWQKRDRSPSELVQGDAVDTAKDWVESKYSQISPLEREFIHLSSDKQKQNDKAKKRLRRSIIGGLAGGITIVSLLWRQAEIERRAAVSNNITSLAKSAELLFERNNQLDALQKAKEAAELIKKEGGLNSEITLPAIATLRDIINRLHEKKVLSIDAINVGSDLVNKNIVFVDSDNRINTYNLDRQLIEKSSPEKDIYCNKSKGDTFCKILVFDNGQSLITVRTGDSKNILELWQRNPETGKWLNKDKKNIDLNITAVAFSPDSQVLAVALDRGGVQLYQNLNYTLTKKNLALPIKDYVEDLKFTFDGQTLVAATTAGTVEIWNILKQQKTIIPVFVGKKVSAISISPNGDKIATGNEIGTIKVWNMQRKLLYQNTVSKQKISDLNFSRDGQLLAWAGEDKTIGIWNFNNREQDTLKTFAGHADSVQSVNFSPDGKTLVSASADRTVRLWQIDPINSQSDRAYSFSYSPDGELLALATPKGDVTILDRKQQKNLHSFPTNYDTKIADLSVSIDRHLATIALDNNQVKLWTIDGREVKTPKPLIGNHCIFSPNQSILAIATTDNKINIYDRNGRFVRNWKTEQSILTHLSFTPDGSNIITGDTKGQVKLWSLDGKVFSYFPLQPGRIRDVSYNVERKIVAIASGNVNQQEPVTLWSRHGQLIRPLDTLTGIDTITFSRDGRVLLTGKYPGQLQFWNLNGDLLKTIIDTADPDDRISNISKVRFGADDREFVAIDDVDGKIIHNNLNLEQLLKQADNWRKP